MLFCLARWNSLERIPCVKLSLTVLTNREQISPSTRVITAACPPLIPYQFTINLIISPLSRFFSQFGKSPLLLLLLDFFLFHYSYLLSFSGFFFFCFVFVFVSILVLLFLCWVVFCWSFIVIVIIISSSSGVWVSSVCKCYTYIERQIATTDYKKY